MKMPQSSLLFGTLLFTLSALSTGSPAGASSEGASGREARASLQDLIVQNRFELVPDNEQFLRSAPGFLELVELLAKASPHFALTVWNDLLGAKIWVTPWRFTPATRTETRVENEIWLSLAALQGKKASVLLLERSLQGILPAMDADRDSKLYSFLQTLQKKPYRLNFEALSQSLAPLGYAFNASTMGPDAFTAKALQTLMLGLGSGYARCALYALARRGSLNSLAILGLGNLSALDRFRNYSDCESDAYLGYLAQEFPMMRHFATPSSGYELSFSSLPEVPHQLGKWSGLTKGAEWDVRKQECQKYASPEARAEIEQARAALAEYQSFYTRLLHEVEEAREAAESGHIDRAKGLFVQAWTFSSFPLFLPKTEARQARAEELSDMLTRMEGGNSQLFTQEMRFEKNVQTCASLLGKAYLAK